MEMRRGNEGQGSARSASKAPAKKQAGEQASPEKENTGATPQAAGQQARAAGEQDLLTHAKEAGGEIVSKVQERAGSQINRQKDTAATEISQVANAVRRIRETI